MSCDICRPGHYRPELSASFQHCPMCHQTAVPPEPPPLRPPSALWARVLDVTGLRGASAFVREAVEEKLRSVEKE